MPPTERFTRARKRVTLHYQWLIRHDYLPRICQTAVLDDVFTDGRKLVEPDAVPTSIPTMPVEFSVAAFRLGHSMVRASYNWNRRFPGTAGSLDFLFAFSGTSGDMFGDVRLPSNWIADWRRMYDFPAGGRPGLAAPGGNVNRAMRIDTRLTDPLADLPLGSFGGDASIPDGDLRRNLAFRNLVRANMVKLASGQQMVTRLKAKGVNVTALTRAQILDGKGGAKLDHLTAAEKNAVVARTPLWFYVLREAELNDGRLKGVGARIVAETFHRAMEGSRFSIVRNPEFRPSLGRDDTTFEMTDLLFFAFGGKAGINPLGGGLNFYLRFPGLRPVSSESLSPGFTETLLVSSRPGRHDRRMNLLTFHRVRTAIQENASPADRAELAPVAGTLRELLTSSGVFETVEVEHTGDPDRLVIGLCAFRPFYTERDVAARFEEIWSDRVRYPFWESHAVHVEEGHVEFEAASRAERARPLRDGAPGRAARRRPGAAVLDGLSRSRPRR